MSHKPRLTKFLVDAQAEATRKALSGGWVEIMQFDPPMLPEGPAPEDALLARVKLADVAFSKPDNGVMFANALERATAIRTGDPKWVRFLTADGVVAADGTYVRRDKNASANAEGNVGTIIQGQFVDVTGIKWVIPKTN